MPTGPTEYQIIWPTMNWDTYQTTGAATIPNVQATAVIGDVTPTDESPEDRVRAALQRMGEPRIDLNGDRPVYSRTVPKVTQEQMQDESVQKIKPGSYIKALKTLKSTYNNPPYEAITKNQKYMFYKYARMGGTQYMIVVDNDGEQYYMFENDLKLWEGIKRNLPCWL